MITIEKDIIKISSEYNKAPQLRDADGLMETFSKDIKRALTKRLNMCVRNFQAHITDLTYISEEHCEYLREDGSIAYYNPYSVRKMNAIFNHLDNKDYVFILSDPFACNQIIKALISYYNCPESLQVKYDDLIAVLLDHIMQFQCMSQDQ